MRDERGEWAPSRVEDGTLPTAPAGGLWQPFPKTLGSRVKEWLTRRLGWEMLGGYQPDANRDWAVRDRVKENEAWAARWVRRQIVRHDWLYERCVPNNRMAEARRTDYDLLVEGFPRSGNSYAATLLRRLLGQGVRVASHFHHPYALRCAVERGKPAVLLIRKPEEVVVSLCLRERIALVEALQLYTDYHQGVLPWGRGVELMRFEEVVRDIQPSLDRLKERFGLEFAPSFDQAQMRSEVLEEIESRARRRDGTLDVWSVAVPCDERRSVAARLGKELQMPRYAPLLRAARRAFDAVVEEC